MLRRNKLLFSAFSSRRPFTAFARFTSGAAGHPVTFLLAVFVIVLWLVTGPVFSYSDTWQLAINTFTTIVTFLMVFLIQSTQNRDSQAMQIKLDELIRTDGQAHNALLDLEELTEAELLIVKERYIVLAERARKGLEKGKSDTGIPKV